MEAWWHNGSQKGSLTDMVVAVRNKHLLFVQGYWFVLNSSVCFQYMGSGIRDEKREYVSSLFACCGVGHLSNGSDGGELFCTMTQCGARGLPPKHMRRHSRMGSQCPDTVIARGLLVWYECSALYFQCPKASTFGLLTTHSQGVARDVLCRSIFYHAKILDGVRRGLSMYKYHRVGTAMTEGTIQDTSLTGT